MFDVVLAGVGGQGTVLASRLLARAAMEAGFDVRTAETIGMAQRGGCVVSHVRIGGCASPLIGEGEADLIIGFEPAEAVRCLHLLKEGGRVLTCDRAVRPVTASLSGSDYDGSAQLACLRQKIKDLRVMPASVVIEKTGSADYINVMLLGAACALGAEEIDLGALERVIPVCVKPKYAEPDLKAVKAGHEWSVEQWK